MPKYSCAPPLETRKPVTHLVEYEDDAVTLGYFTKLMKELGQDRLKPHVRACGFEDDRGYVVVVLQGLLKGLNIVGGQHYHCAECLSRYAADSLGAGHEIVAPAVEVVLELDDLGFAGVGARHANGHHVGLGARTVESHLLGAWDQFPDPVAPLHFDLSRAGEVSASGHLLLDCADNLGA